MNRGTLPTSEIIAKVGDVVGKRNDLEIVAEMLSLCRQPQIKTKLMYETNLSWRMLQKYLSRLQSLELLEVHHSATKYATTSKGLKFLEKWKELLELISVPVGEPSHVNLLKA